MRKSLVLLTVLALVASALTAPAMAGKKKKKTKRTERVVEVRYEAPAAIGSGDAGGVCAGCPSIPNAANETWMKVEVIDDALPIGGVDISPGDLNGDGFYDSGWFVCGESEWIEVPGGSEMQTFPYLVSGSQCPGGGATSGTIRVTYSNMPPPGD
ncbi:MAG: hypothetical protein ACLGHL_00830 [Actinomycetota bacterium]